jgi:hypothetical protein
LAAFPLPGYITVAPRAFHRVSRIPYYSHFRRDLQYEKKGSQMVDFPVQLAVSTIGCALCGEDVIGFDYAELG